MNRIAVTVDPERVEIVLDGLAGGAPMRRSRETVTEPCNCYPQAPIIRGMQDQLYA